MTYYAFPEMPARTPAEGIEMRVIQGERMTLAFFTIAQDSGIPEHTHPPRADRHGFEGQLQLMIAGEKRIVAPGGAYHIPSNATHSGLCVEGPVEVLEMFSPVREDWLGS